MADDELKRIRSGVFDRAFSVAKVSLKGSVKAGWHRITTITQNETEKAATFKRHLIEQATAITSELTQLKGSLMKAGQLMSVYGEQFLPPEVNEVLKTLQNKSTPLAWEPISKVLTEQLGEEKLALLEIERIPVGSASLGQVYRATIKASGKAIALKVQYPGVEKAIESDLKLLKRILRAGNWIPFSPGLDAVFDEAKNILHQEVDYEKEFRLTAQYRDLLKDDSRFIIPEPIAEFSSGKVLATSFEDGVAVDSPEVLALPQERRDRLAMQFFDLYLKEIFELNQVQTDPHFGNYRVRLRRDSIADQIVSLDFGAVRVFDPDFMSKFKKIFKAAFLSDETLLIDALKNVGIVNEGDPQDWSDRLVELCKLMTEPVRSVTPYDWGESDLAARALKQARSFIFRPSVRLPPPEMLSLDRKSAGVFVLLSKWKAKIAVRPLLERYFDRDGT